MAVVMVVDDDPDARWAVGTFLSGRGHRVTCARDGKDAIELMSSDPADAVVLDARMPIVDGIAFLEVLRCYLRWRQTPVFMVTGYSRGPHVERASELGVIRVFLKGQYSLEELSDCLEATIGAGLGHSRSPDGSDRPS